jgi:acetolactate synthase-1/2/3 large subunit
MDRIKTSQITGAEIVVRCLQQEGVEYVFGYPGGAVLFIYDELFKQDKVRHVLVRHEQGAVHAADGYSRSSKKVGVCLVPRGRASPTPSPVSPPRTWIRFRSWC